jgi:hypothetical protein
MSESAEIWTGDPIGVPRCPPQNGIPIHAVESFCTFLAELESVHPRPGCSDVSIAEVDVVPDDNNNEPRDQSEEGRRETPR